jgi:hypothetical protein
VRVAGGKEDERRLTASFDMKPSYLFEQSRRFRNLKVWMKFQTLRQPSDWRLDRQ